MIIETKQTEDLIVQDTQQPQPLPNSMLPITNLFENEPFLRVTATVPTGIPRNPLSKFVLYKSGATKRLYIYDSLNNAWYYTTLT